MKSLIVLCLVALAVAAPQQQDFNQVFRYYNDNDGLGNYKFGFEQSDGTSHDQQGELKNEGRQDESIVVRGSYSWIAPNNIRYTVTYIADENGYRPKVEEGAGGGLGGGYSPDVLATLLGG